MKISRSGATAYHGKREVNLDEPSIEYSKFDSSLMIRHSKAKDFNTEAHHSYTITIKSNELNKMLVVLAKAATTSPEIFEAQLAPSLKALAQLHAVASGVFIK